MIDNLQELHNRSGDVLDKVAIARELMEDPEVKSQVGQPMNLLNLPPKKDMAKSAIKAVLPMFGKRHIQPKSLTWWSGFVPLLGGVCQALAPHVPILEPVSAIANEMSGGLSASQLIWVGLGVIGVRGAFK